MFQNAAFAKKMHAAVALIVSLALAAVISGVPAPSAALADEPSPLMTAQATKAATAKTLKSKGVKFDLKKNKTVYSNMALRGAGKVKYGIKMTNYKVTALKNGKKRITFTFDWKMKSKLSSSKANKALRILQKGKSITPYYFTHFVDFESGLNLEDKAVGKDMSFVKKTLKETPTKTYRSASGAWFYIWKEVKAKWTVTVPADYDNLAVGVGWGASYDDTMSKADREFEWVEGSGRTYYETSWFKKLKSNFHFMHVK